jgi:predicted esterase
VKLHLSAAVLGASLALLPWAALAATAPPSYAYDAFASLELSVDDSTTDGALRIDTIAFRSQNQVVHAVIVSPRSGGNAMPGVLFAHWLGDPATTNHTEFLEDAKWLGRRGVVSILLDEPWSAPDWFERLRTNDTDDRDAVATVIAMRRALDVLTGRPGVDTKNLAFVGHDFGAMYGALLLGADPRPANAVLMTPTTTFAEWFELDTARPPKNKAAYEAKMAAFDIDAALAKAGLKAALLQFSESDRYVPKVKANEFADAVSARDKTVRFYRTGHALAIDAATDERRAWLSQHLRL